MSPKQAAIVRRHLSDLPAHPSGENALLPTLVAWLVTTGRLGPRTSLAYEVPWLGRRVDLALLTSRGIATAFELKIGRLQRVLEQATYNGSTFHRSWVVTANRPKPEGLAWAVQLGLGLLVVRDGVVNQLTSPTLRSPNPAIVARLRKAIVTRAVER